MRKLELFSEKILELFPFPFPPANFFKICVPKSENFPFLFEEKTARAKSKKCEEIFQVLEFRKIGTAEAETTKL